MAKRGRPKGSKNKTPEPCQCSEIELMRTAYWWSSRKWIALHTGRDLENYYSYRNSATKQLTKKELGTGGKYINSFKKCS